MKLKLSFLITFIYVLLSAQSAPAYYNSIDFTKKGNELKTQLASLIKSTHTTTTSYAQLLTIYATSDADPAVKGNILLIYGNTASGITQRSRGYSGGDFNREHVFPKSLGNPNLGTSGPGSDAHHVRPADIQLNSNRGNLPFADGSGAAAGKSNGGWYPGDEWKGDVARIIFYMYLRYGSQTLPDVVGLGSNTYASDIPDIFIKWNVEDPVSDFEKQRQEVVYGKQGNRNPFIDNPYLATVIWGGPAAQNTWPNTFNGGTTPTPDTEKPTAPTNLAAGDVTSSTIALSWTASTDNVGVLYYDLYQDGVLKTSINGSQTTATVTGLSASTAYTYYIVARDAAGNQSAASNTITASTNNVVITPPADTTASVIEDFEKIPTSSSSSYSARTWTNNSITWNSTYARTDQTINTKAITIDSQGGNGLGTLTSSSVADGVGSLTVTTQLKYAGTAGVLTLKVNGVKVGEIPYSDEVETTTISNINVSGNVVVSIENSNSARARVAIDDLSWTKYSNLGTAEANAANGKITVYPNPVKNKEFYISGLSEKVTVDIFNANGQLVQKVTGVTNNQRIVLQNVPAGFYIIKAGNSTQKLIVQ